MSISQDEFYGRVGRLAESADVAADVGRMPTLPSEAFEPQDEGDFLALGPIGHGLAGWRFRLRARTSALDFDFVLPCPGALEDEETRNRQAEDLATVCKLASATVRIAADGRFEGRRLVAVCSEEGDCIWRIVGSDGTEECRGTAWPGLVDALVGLSDRCSKGIVRIEG